MEETYNGWLGSPLSLLFYKSTKGLGHPTFYNVIALHTSPIVKAYRMIGWPVLLPTISQKVRNV